MIWLLFLFIQLSAGTPALSPATSDRVVISRQTDTQVQDRFQNVDVSEEQIQQSKHRYALEHLEPDPAHSIFDRGNLVANPLQRTTTANPQQQTTKSKPPLVLVTGGSRRHSGGVNLQQQRGRRSVPVVADREYDVLVSDFNEDEAPVRVVAAKDSQRSTPSGSVFSTRVVNDAEIKDPRAIEAPIRQHRVHVPAHLLELQSEETDEPIRSTTQSTTTTKLTTSTKRITTKTKLSTTRQPSATAPPPVEFSGEEPTGNFFDEKEEDDGTTTESPEISTPAILPVQKAERALTTLLTKLTERTTKKIESTTLPTKIQKLSAVKFENILSEVHRDVSVPKAEGFLLLDRTVRKPRRMLANFVNLRHGSGISRRRRQANFDSVQPIPTQTTTAANSIEFEEEIVTTPAATVPVTAPVVDLDLPSNSTENSTIAFTVIADAESTVALTEETSTKSVAIRTHHIPSSLLIKSEEETTKSQPDSELRDIAPPDEAAGVLEAKPTTRLPSNNRIALTPRPQQTTGERNESPPQQVIPQQQQQPIPAFQPQFIAQPQIQAAGPQPILNHFVIGNRRIIVPSISFEQHFAAQQFGGQFPTAQFVPIQQPPQPIPQFVPAPQQPPPSSQLSFDSPRIQPPPVVVQPQLPTTATPSILRTTKSTLPDIIRTPAPVANSHIHSVNFDLYDEVGAANSK
ncbi:hypothetical protein M3Y96_00445500 [Aphelenchoides besseyi]|nr:hypothetical protein M3Y96_00445500 [Aphelenchoides besseyi]